MITPENLVKHELIGLEVEIVGSTNRSQMGIKGRVVDETYNTIKIETKKGEEKAIIKKDVVFLFKLPGGERVQVDGNVIVSRPEDRVKKKFKRW